MSKYPDIVAVQAKLRDLAWLPLAERATALRDMWCATRIGSAAEAAVETAILTLVPELAALPVAERVWATVLMWGATSIGSAAHAAAEAALVEARVALEAARADAAA